jgi:hypothetical protein
VRIIHHEGKLVTYCHNNDGILPVSPILLVKLASSFLYLRSIARENDHALFKNDGECAYLPCLSLCCYQDLASHPCPTAVYISSFISTFLFSTLSIAKHNLKFHLDFQSCRLQDFYLVLRHCSPSKPPNQSVVPLPLHRRSCNVSQTSSSTIMTSSEPTRTISSKPPMTMKKFAGRTNSPGNLPVTVSPKN